MDGPHRRDRRAPGARLAGVVAVLGLLVAVLTLPSVHSAFSATTANLANSLAADRLLPPSGLIATQSCSMFPIAFRGAAASTSMSPLALNPPGETRAGDVLVAQVAYYGTSTVTAPSGWTLVLTDTSGGLVTSAVYWKVATASEPAAAFSRPSSSTGDMVGGIVAYSGVDRSNPVAVAGKATGSGETATSPAITTTLTDTVIVHFLTKQPVALPTPAGTRGRWTLSSDSEGATAADEPFVGPGTTPTRSSTSPGSAGAWIALAVALRPAVQEAGAVLSWTASPSSWADGYRVERTVGGTVQGSQAVPFGTTTVTDAPLVNGTTYDYRIRTHRGTWLSTAVTTTLTPSC